MGAMVKYTSSLKAGRGKAGAALSHEFATYVDDTGKFHFDRSNAYFLPMAVRLGHRPAPPKPNAPSKIIFPPNHSRGEIHLAGFLVTRALEAGLAPSAPAETAARRAWVDKVSSLWAADLARIWGTNSRGLGEKSVIALKFAIAPDPKDTAALTASHHSAVGLMRRCCTTFFREYEKLHELTTGSLGWAWAVHLDRGHLHAHCVAFPYTSDGNKLRLSNRMPDPDHPGQRRDLLDEFRERVGTAYHEEIRVVTEHTPRATLVEQLHRSLGGRIVVAAAGAWRADPEGMRSQVVDMVVAELNRERGGERLAADEVGPVLRRWAIEGAKRLSPLSEPKETIHPSAPTDFELAWWRRLWIALDWRRRRRDGRENTWPEFAELSSRLQKGEKTGPVGDALPKLLFRAAGDRAPSLSIVPSPQDPPWAPLGRLRLVEWLNQGRELVLRALVTDAISIRAGRDEYLRTWFEPETLRYSRKAPAVPEDRALGNDVAEVVDKPLRRWDRLPDLTDASEPSLPR